MMAQLAGYVLIALVNVVIGAPVVDQAGILTEPERSSISSRLRALRNSSGVQMAVVTVLSTYGEPLADFSHRTAVAWGGGQRGRDDGLLLTLAIGEQRLRLETGYGLEAKIPDVAARQMIDSAKSELQAKRYGAAIEKVLDQICARLATQDPAVGLAPANGTSDVSATRGTDPLPERASDPWSLANRTPQIRTYSDPPSFLIGDLLHGLVITFLFFGGMGGFILLIVLLLRPRPLKEGGSYGVSSGGDGGWSDRGGADWGSGSSSWSSGSDGGGSNWGSGGGDWGGGGGSDWGGGGGDWGGGGGEGGWGD